MSLETTTCPRCESTSTAHLPESIGFDQWICNQCSHQWDFASQEERALVPNHLTGSRIEQFLEEFLAIKAVIKGEAEKIWNDCANAAHQAISIPGNDDKIRLFGEQVDRWGNQLIGLQETLMIDRLLPLAVKYQVSSNEQIWLSQACQQAMTPVTAGYAGWFTFAIRGHLYGAEPWVIPDWAWRLRGAPRQIADLDVTQDEKVSSLLHCLAGTLEYDLAMHRKGGIAKAFLTLKPGKPLSGARFVGENLKPKKHRIKKRTEPLQQMQNIHGPDVAKLSRMSSAAIAKIRKDAQDGENPVIDYVTPGTMERAGQTLGVTQTPYHAPRVALPPELRSVLEKLQRLFAVTLHDAKFDSCHWAWHDIKRTKSAKKKKEIFNKKFERWREDSANAIRNWLPRFFDLATAYPEVIDDPIYWAKDSVWGGVEGVCGIQRPQDGEPLPIDWVVNDTMVWWFAVASEFNPEVNLPPLRAWRAPRWLARDRRETDELLGKHTGYLWLRVNRVIEDEIALAEIGRASNRKVEEHKAEPLGAKHTAYQGMSATAPSAKNLWTDQRRPRDKTRRSTSVSLSEFEATVGKLMVEARTMCAAKYLPRAEILRIADLLDDKGCPVRENLEREAARAMAEFNERYPKAAIKSWRAALSHPQFRRAIRKRFSRAEEKYKKATPSVVSPSAETSRTTI
jgi:hypothetical protein